MTQQENSIPAGAERRQNQAVVWIAGATVVAVVITVVGFNTVGRSLIDACLHAERRASPASAPTSPANDATIPAPASAVSADESEAKSPSGAAPGTTDATTSAASTGAAAPTMTTTAFAPPAADAIPAGPMGDVIRQGEQLFINTKVNAPKFVGNALNCVNCHLDAGRKADSAPMWGAYPMYPAYRSKTKHVDTFAERLRGCFAYSMNGTAPPFGDDVLVALEAYAYWMAKGAPTGESPPGAGYRKLAAAAQPPDGARVSGLRGEMRVVPRCRRPGAASGRAPGVPSAVG